MATLISTVGLGPLLGIGALSLGVAAVRFAVGSAGSTCEPR